MLTHIASTMQSHRFRRVRFLLLVVLTLAGVFYYSFLNESYELNQHQDEEELPHITGSEELNKEQLDAMDLSDWITVVEKNKYFPLFNDGMPGTKVSFRLPEDYFENQKKITIRKWKKKEHYPVGKENYNKIPRVGKTSEYPDIQAKDFSDGGTKDEAKLERIKAAFTKSWKVYKDYAYGHDEVTPISHKAQDPFNGWSATLVDSLDTLALMGLEDELKEAVTFVKERVNFQQCYRDVIPLFENTIRILGGLLAAYDITGDKGLLTPSKEIGDLLMEAFDTPNRMPLLFYYWSSDAQNRLPSKFASLAEVGTLSLEFARLTQVTGDNKYYDAIDRITDKFHKSKKNFILKGLYSTYLDISGCRQLTQREVNDGAHLNNKKVHKVIKGNKFVYCEFVDDIKSLHKQEDYTLAGLGDSFYEYLPKMYHLLRGVSSRSADYKEMYESALYQIKQFMLFTPKVPGGEDVLFVTGISVYDTKDYIEVTPRNEMQHLACFTGGMLALGAKLFDNPEDMEYAEKVTKGCVLLYDLMGIMPEQIEVDRMDPGDKYDEEKRKKQILGEHLPKGPEKPIDEKIFDGELDTADMTKEQKEALAKKIDEVMTAQAKADAEADKVEGGEKGKREVIEHVTVVEKGKPINFNIVERGRFQPFVTDPDGKRRWPVLYTYDQPLYINEMHPTYLLRPEAIESVFYMYRLTGEAKWREHGWRMWENIEKYAQKKGMFTAVVDVTRPVDQPQRYDDAMESFWFSETLKYFYLLFDDASVLSLDEWVYNTEAHPFKLVN